MDTLTCTTDLHHARLPRAVCGAIIVCDAVQLVPRCALRNQLAGFTQDCLPVKCGGRRRKHCGQDSTMLAHCSPVGCWWLNFGGVCARGRRKTVSWQPLVLHSARGPFRENTNFRSRCWAGTRKVYRRISLIEKSIDRFRDTIETHCSYSLDRASASL